MFNCDNSPRKPCKSCEKHKNNICPIKSAWTRGIQKYLPSHNVNLSPVKPTECILNPVTNKRSIGKLEFDHVKISGVCWLINMTEQLYYDNSLLLISKYIDEESKINNVLRVNYSNIQGEQVEGDWVEVSLLGNGSFGIVVKVLEISTFRNYAVKYINPRRQDDLIFNFKEILSYLNERNYLLRARDSISVVKFYSAYQIPGLSGYFLCFEFCLMDLSEFLSGLNKNRINLDHLIISRKSEFNIEEQYEALSKTHNIDNFIDIIKIYTFECFCILDFLGENQIVHRDIKPANLMISENFHLKLADFGLVYDTTFLTDRFKKRFVTHSEIDRVLSSRAKKNICGTSRYLDMETLLTKITLNFDEFLPYLKDLPVGIDENNTDMDFLSDLWAMTLTVLEILCLGNRILNPDHLTEEQFESIGVIYTEYYLVNLGQFFLNRETTESFVQDGIRFLFEKSIFKELMFFILLTFQVKQYRCPSYLKSKTVLFLENKQTMKYLDIEAIEQMEIYSNMNLNHRNVFLYQMPKNLGQMEVFLKKQEVKTTFDTMSDFIKKLKTTENNVKLLNLGTQSNIKLI